LFSPLLRLTQWSLQIVNLTAFVIDQEPKLLGRVILRQVM